MADRLLNKVALITGAASGIGRAITELYLAEGARVVLFGRRRGLLEEVASRATARALVVDGDVTRRDDLDRLAESIGRRFGGLDILVAAAATTKPGPLATTDPAEIARQFDVNVAGALATVQAVLPSLHSGGGVLLFGAAPSAAARPGGGLHAATKAAIASLARSLSEELKPRRIRVNVIAPGPVATALWNGQAASSEAPAEPNIEAALRQVAEAALFLASDAAAGIDGQQIVVDADN